jgi:hypothetical protein
MKEKNNLLKCTIFAILGGCAAKALLILKSNSRK